MLQVFKRESHDRRLPRRSTRLDSTRSQTLEVALAWLWHIFSSNALLILQSFLALVYFLLEYTADSKQLLGFGVGFGMSYKSLIISNFLALAVTAVSVIY
jgi:hypothetical protein